MKTAIRGFVICALLLAMMQAGSGSASAQIPDEFTNLKVLSKDTSKRELIVIMRAFSGALGVACSHCHPPSEPGSDKVDFASDALEAKRVARAMMAMSSEINHKLMPSTGLESPARVRCVTCHRGVTKPETLDRILLAVVDEGGVEAALARYREMREELYGEGSYDFRSGTLTDLAQVLAQDRGDLVGAIAVMKLNVEMHPDEAPIHMMLGQLFVMKGDADSAQASFERSLELDPENAQVRALLERLTQNR
jgi:tetratricopeptide (TPR) repeat protein